MQKEQALTLTVLEVAALLQISRGSAYEAVRSGQIPSVRFGRSIRVPIVALEQLLKQSGQGPHAEEAAT